MTPGIPSYWTLRGSASPRGHSISNHSLGMRFPLSNSPLCEPGVPEPPGKSGIAASVPHLRCQVVFRLKAVGGQAQAANCFTEDGLIVRGFAAKSRRPDHTPRGFAGKGCLPGSQTVIELCTPTAYHQFEVGEFVAEFGDVDSVGAASCQATPRGHFSLLPLPGSAPTRSQSLVTKLHPGRYFCLIPQVRHLRPML